MSYTSHTPAASAPLSQSAIRELNRMQAGFESLYRLESAPDILPFVRVAQPGTREQVLVQQTSTEEVSLRVVLPEESISALVQGPGGTSLDALLEAVEAVSHFTYLCRRARTNLPATLLELELQAEVDKFAFLATEGRLRGARDPSLSPAQLRCIHRRLYEDVQFLHPPTSPSGARYRLANELAARWWARMLSPSAPSSILPDLRRFYRAGQTEKIALARAA